MAHSAPRCQRQQRRQNPTSQQGLNAEPAQPPQSNQGQLLRLRQVQPSRHPGQPEAVQLVLAFLSKGVDVPDAHVRQGSVILFKGPDGRPFDARRLTQGLFHVCVQKHRPLRSDLAVYYRGYWYYISEDDVQSRATLNYVKLVLDMRSEAGSSPVLTLPVN